MIPVQCSGCQQKYKAPDAAAGKSIKCKACGVAIAIPKPPEPEPEQLAADLLLSDATFMANPLGVHNESMAFGYKVGDEGPDEKPKSRRKSTPTKPQPGAKTKQLPTPQRGRWLWVMLAVVGLAVVIVVVVVLSRG
jgi:hypothetical protein